MPCQTCAPSASPPVPTDWTLALNFTGGGLYSPQGIAIDASGNVWVTDFYSSAGVNSGNGSVSELNVSGNPASGSPFTGGGLGNPSSIAIDASGNVWVANYTGHSVTEFVGAAAPVKAPLIGLPQKP